MSMFYMQRIVSEGKRKFKFDTHANWRLYETYTRKLST